MVLRPEPGGRTTAERLAAAGLPTLQMPLFETTAIDWTPPSDRYDALLLTSANAVRHAGAGLSALRALPVVAVGNGTAAAAREAGFVVAAVGKGNGAQALALAHQKGWRRILRLAARDRTVLEGVTDLPVYASNPLIPPLSALKAAVDTVALVHSSRAASVFRELLERDAVPVETIRLAAISEAVAAAAGTGWNRIMVAPKPNDAALVEIACTLAIDP
ncbi:uroporphyrinogen-III synthase [Sphingomonas mucosissima]|uniref:uroporphyrinogen-III synthase n=1 Tax=Sphingomonas mucosissima TaxID=370959 RepID=UPI001FE428C3|nr:uroporphyrinogen-III synthase [Sphingomonas mucosissima]